jgi:hypothetical protein
MKRRILWLVVVLLLVLNTACSSSASLPRQDVPTPSSSVSMPAASATIAAKGSTATSVPAISPTPSRPFPTGTFKANRPQNVELLVFKQDGTFYYVDLPNAVPEGTYTVSGDHMTFTETASQTLCDRQGQTGEYLWSYDGSNLVFKAVKDDCFQRRMEFPASEWVKQP